VLALLACSVSADAAAGPDATCLPGSSDVCGATASQSSSATAGNYLLQSRTLKGRIDEARLADHSTSKTLLGDDDDDNNDNNDNNNNHLV